MTVITFFMVIMLSCQALLAEEYCFEGGESPLGELLNELPEELREEFNELTLGKPNETVRTVLEKTKLDYWYEKVAQTVRDILNPSVKMALSLIGMLILTASIRLLSEKLCGTSFGRTFELCSDICMATAIASVGETVIRTASEYLDRLCGIMNVMIPVTELIYLTEASVTSFSVHKTAMLLYIAITSNLNNLVLKPMFGVLFAFAVSGTVFQQFGITGFIEGFKKTVMIALSVFTMIFSFVLDTQTVLAKSADSLALKGVRLVLNSFIPIVGGTLSEALTTVKEGFGAIRGVAGIIGIMIIVLLILPTAANLVINGLILSFCCMTAEILDCGSSVNMIKGLRAVLSILSAIVYATTLLFIFALVIFTKAGAGG